MEVIYLWSGKIIRLSDSDQKLYDLLKTIDLQLLFDFLELYDEVVDREDFAVENMTDIFRAVMVVGLEYSLTALHEKKMQWVVAGTLPAMSDLNLPKVPDMTDKT